MIPIPLVALLLVLAACSTGVPVGRQVVVPGGQYAAVQGEARFVVRSFLPPEENQRREVIGATCDLVTSLYKTSLVTPAQVVVPNFGPQSPEVTVSCRTPDGAGAGSARIFTRWQQAPGFWGDPYFGPWGGPWGWSAPGYPVSSYPNIDVTLFSAKGA